MPLAALLKLYLVTDDGRVLAVAPRTFEPAPPNGTYLYQEFCPVTPRVISRLTPDRFAAELTDESNPSHVPRLVFCDLTLGDLKNNPASPHVDDLPYPNQEGAGGAQEFGPQGPPSASAIIFSDVPLAYAPEPVHPLVRTSNPGPPSCTGGARFVGDRPVVPERARDADAPGRRPGADVFPRRLVYKIERTSPTPGHRAVRGPSTAGTERIMSMGVPTRWVTETDEGHSQWYIDRFRRMAADGVDLGGEARLLDAMVPPRSRILDAGCGPGRVGAILHDRGHHVVGVDADPELIAAARHDHPGPTWVVADLADLDLPATGLVSPFDAAVLAGNVLAFVADGTEPDVLRRLAAHLVPDGIVVVGCGTDRGYALADFEAHVAAAGLVLEHRFATWDLRPWHDGAEFAVSVLRFPAPTREEL